MQCHLFGRHQPTVCLRCTVNLALILVCHSHPSLQEKKSQDSIMHGLSFHVRGADSCRQIVGTNIELEAWFSKLCTLNQVYITP